MHRIFNVNIKKLLANSSHLPKSNSFNKIISSKYNQIATSNKFDYSTNFHNLTKTDDKNQIEQQKMREPRNAHDIKHQFTISNKTECLHLLKKSSDKLLNVLDTFKWVKLAPKIGFQVKNHIDNPILNDFKSFIFKMFCNHFFTRNLENIKHSVKRMMIA